ncbi:H-NS histone family protein [Burkholderia vietnamiensis]|jgi:DNA-binding protein H-NS|uniref:H-NS histone family protein n=1 Tax=Burkholderia vietnamiensis TaxID=60552 RepID=UPI001B9FA869|nr:H-NS histone family protein [Burkholderia vietnamiensis]MBR8087043.1 H-NS histone family protein [Burkholderia vietnamiensis]
MSDKTYAQLVAELDELDRQIAVARVQARKEALKQISALMFEFDIRPNDLRRPRNIRYNVQPTRPRYRDPETGATWSGRGHMPAWIAGKDKRLFLIDGE